MDASSQVPNVPQSRVFILLLIFCVAALFLRFFFAIFEYTRPERIARGLAMSLPPRIDESVFGVLYRGFLVLYRGFLVLFAPRCIAICASDPDCRPWFSSIY